MAHSPYPTERLGPSTLHTREPEDGDPTVHLVPVDTSSASKRIQSHQQIIYPGQSIQLWSLHHLLCPTKCNHERLSYQRELFPIIQMLSPYVHERHLPILQGPTSDKGNVPQFHIRPACFLTNLLLEA